MTSLRKELPPLFVFADDWGRHPSSCQHLIRGLLPKYRVHWFNTIGMRPPRLDRVTFNRVTETLNRWVRGPGPSIVPSSGVHPLVIDPKMWPWFRSRLDRQLNATLLSSRITREVNRSGELPVMITTIPIVADLVGRIPAKRWVYYCVDDFGQWPGLDGIPLSTMEQELVRKADVLVAVSESLRDRLRSLGRNSHLLTHGVDFDHWSSPEGTLPEPIAKLSRPLVVFWGVVDRRLDSSAIIRLADDLTEGTIVLVGPTQNPDRALYRHPRIVLPGPVTYEELPTLAREAAVLIMPYDELPVTRAIQPLKMKEYLATMCPVVVSSLPSTRHWADALDVTHSSVEFSCSVRTRIETGLPRTQADARSRLLVEGWQAKTVAFERWILGEVEPETHERMGYDQ